MRGLLETTFLAGPLQEADISFVMEENGQPFLSLNPEKALIPASNMKLVMSAAALLLDMDKELFPPLLSFKDGEILNGVLKGNLIIDSCGSLIFSARYPVNNNFDDKNELLKKQVSLYVQQLQKSGIKEIEGQLLLSIERWNGPQENKHYNAASAFCYNENTVDTLVEDQKLYTVPHKPLIFNFEEDSKVGTQDKVENNKILYNPKVNSRDYWRLSQYPTSRYALTMLEKEIATQGIKVHRNKLKADKKELLFQTNALYSSSEYIKPINTYSDNLRAELLALLINRLMTKKASYENLNMGIQKVFNDIKLPLKSLNADDGSGLSRKNRIAAIDINRLLKYMAKNKNFDSYLNSMALAGKSGTLQKRFKGSPWEGKFYGKTGTLNGVSSLSGYWIRKNKPLMTFSFIGNNAKNEVFWDALEKFAASMKFKS